MKKSYLIIILIFSISSVYAQSNIHESGGNVGIGTTNPQSKLHIYQNATDQAGLIVQGNTINTDFAQHYVAITLDGDYGNGTGNYSQIRSYSNLYKNWGSQLAFFTTSSSVGSTLGERMRIDGRGNVGIGTSEPENAEAWTKVVEIKGGTDSKMLVSSDQINTGIWSHNFGFYGAPAGGIAGTATNHSFSIMTNKTARMVVTPDGNVGIGIETPTDKLAVNGNIRAREVKVENNNWPDYVFTRDYQLPTLQETEKHIKDKGHLPGIPSAAEVKANGIDLGEMNAKLLQKIEELTLHLIEMKKENQQLRLEVNEIKTKIQ